jgi:hypothetical protein
MCDAMTAGWQLHGAPETVTGDQAVERLRQRLAEGIHDTWFRHPGGRLLNVVTNGHRALVMLLDEPGDPGEHAVEPGATGTQGGYLLDNGQQDNYSNADTVPLEEALEIVRDIVDHDRPPTNSQWHDDRS